MKVEKKHFVTGGGGIGAPGEEVCSLGETDPKPIGHGVPRCRATPKADGGTRRGCHRKVEVPSKDIVETR